MKHVAGSRGLEEVGERGCLIALCGYDFCVPAYENKLFSIEADNDPIFGLAHYSSAVVHLNTTQMKIPVGMDLVHQKLV